MRVKDVEVWCTSVKEPRPYEFEDRSGVSYKIELSDGTGNIEFPVLEDVYPIFEPMRKYIVDLDLIQVNRQTQWGVRKDIKARVVAAQEA